MPHVKIGPKHQITIPKEVFEALELQPGDILEIAVQGGRGVLIPKQILEKRQLPKLSAKNQKHLKTAIRKIRKIQENPSTSKGLTEPEALVAAKVGLIDPEQRWWWAEEWQKGERQAQKDIEDDETEEFEDPKDLLKSLSS